MNELDEIPSDDELKDATKDGTSREGTARIHFKLFPKYGFLLPDNPHYSGETIFFGLTAHVDASRKYIADLREELKADQKVRYMAVPVERDGTTKWKALVVGPLPDDEQEDEKSEENSEEVWLTCSIHPNLQPTHGFATPDGGNQYHDNVYFSLKEASDGLKEPVTDLTKVFQPCEVISALVVPADPRFKAKYRALQICKVSTTNNNRENVQDVIPAVLDEEEALVDKSDVSAVTWIHGILQSKGSMKLTSLTGDVSRNADVRNVVQPQKKSVKRFLSKYPQFFLIKDGEVYPAPDSPEIRSTQTPKNIDATPSLAELGESDHLWYSDEESSTNSENGFDDLSTGDPGSTLFPSTAPLKVFADVSSMTTVAMLATVIGRYRSPMKMSEVYRLCQYHGWEGMKSVAMVAQIVTNNPKYFTLDERNSVSLTTEGKKLTVKQNNLENGVQTENGIGNSQNGFGNSQNGIGNGQKQSIKGNQGSLIFPTQPSSARSAFASTAFVPPRSAAVSRGIYTPIGTPIAATVPEKEDDIEDTFPTSSVLPLNGNFGACEYYLSDNEECLDDKFELQKVSSPRCTDEESRYLSVIARGICPNAIGGKEEVFALLRKELEALGVRSSDADGFGVGSSLSRHLLCVQLDIGKKPRAKFQVFTPSGKINHSTVALSTDKVTEQALSVMLSEAHVQDRIVRVGRWLYGIDKTYHCIRMLTNGMDGVSGCTISFNTQESLDVRVSDLLQLTDRPKFKIILSDMNHGTKSNAACAELRRFSDDHSKTLTIVAVDMEGQIFGYGITSGGDARRMICDSLEMQQRHLKETVHHHPNWVIVNAVDCMETVGLLERIYRRGINVYAEVARGLEANIRNIFKIQT